MFRMYKAAALLSALKKVYTTPCHDRGHINVMLVLQSHTDSLSALPTLSSETFPTSSDGTCDVGNIAVVTRTRGSRVPSPSEGGH
jgi:hypothetical protein